jgi:hypothetical protein
VRHQVKLLNGLYSIAAELMITNEQKDLLWEHYWSSTYRCSIIGAGTVEFAAKNST